MIPPKPDHVTWNDDQWAAIYASHPNILISAGAGSGKTAVLVERIIQKILREKIHVDELLVLTFTEAAAAEMKERIRSRIEEQLQQEPTHEHLNRQLTKISRAQISTFHAFCNQLIKRYYYILGIDPAFKIADDIEVSLIKEEVMEGLFDDLSEVEEEAFSFLSDSFNSDRDDEALKVMVLKVYELARSNPQMMEWLLGLPKLYEWDGFDLSSWFYYETFMKMMNPIVKEAANDLEEAKAFALDSEDEVKHKYPTEVYELDKGYLNRLVEGKEQLYGELRESFYGTKLSAFPRLNKKHFNEEMHGKSKAARDRFKKRLDKVKSQFFGYSNATHKTHLSQSEKVVTALVALVLQFHERFKEAKTSQRLLDFSDLEWGTLELLLKNDQPTDLAQEVAHQFKEIMIDEYQDTNSMQEKIVTAVATVLKPTIPLFMVGDVKQSIYRFRLAEPSIFQEKYEKFSTDESAGIKIDLMKNYRSHQQVIDGTNYVFKQLMDKDTAEIDYNEAAMLKLGVLNEVDDDFNATEVHLIDKEQFNEEGDELSAVELEAHHMARTISNWVKSNQQIYDRKRGETRSVTYQDVVILMRSLTHVTVFQDVFRHYGIPLFTEQNTDLFDSVEIVNMLSCLKVIDNPYQDIPLAGLMRSPLFFFSEQELASIKVSGKGRTFYELVLQYKEEGMDDFLKHKVIDFVTKLERWRFDALLLPLSQLITGIYEQTLYYEFVLGLPHGALRKANLDVFVDRARAYETSTKQGVYGFVNYVDRMKALGKHFGKAKTVTANEDVVRIMSIHKSKGLEFPIVFVAHIHKRFNQQDELGNYVMHKKYGVAVKYIDPKLRLRQKTVVQNMMSALIHNEMLAEEMRLLYVAMTRAKSKLIFTGVMDVTKKLEVLEDVVKDGEWLLPASYRLKAKTYADWLLPIAIKHPTVSQDVVELSPKTLRDESRWRLQIVTAHEALMTADEDENVQDFQPPLVDLEKLFYRNYAHEALVQISAKQSVSQRKEEESTPMFKGIPQLKSEVAYDRPSFMRDQDVSKTEIGTAMHQFMQHLPVRTDYTLDDLHELRKRLVDKEIMKEKMVLEVDLASVLMFTKTFLYQQLSQAQAIKKELPFMTLVKLNDHEQSEILLQGVIDLLAEFENEVWIIDYKTDYVKEFSSQQVELKERYAVQMKYYAKAIKEIYPTKKVTCYVYFLSVQEAIAYND